jgi:WD40 repeat protein
LDVPEGGRVDLLSFAANGKLMASASTGNDTSIRLWDVDAGKLLHRVKGDWTRIANIAFSPDGHMFAAGGQSGDIHLWDAITAKKMREWPAHPGPGTCSTTNANLCAVTC